MGEQVLNQFRSDKALREDCIAIYEAMGMDLNTAFRMFMERTRMVGGLPFPAVLPRTKMAGAEAKSVIDDPWVESANFPGMTLDERNVEIDAAEVEKKELIVKKLAEGEARPGIYNKETGQLLYSLVLPKDGLWHRTYAVKNREGKLIGTLKYKHEAFQLAKMPNIWGYLGEEEVFYVRREFEALVDGIVAEGRFLRTEGAILEGNFKLYYKGECVAIFEKINGQMNISVKGAEPLVVLFALALQCF